MIGPEKITSGGNRYQLAWDPPDFEWLYDQYVIQKKSALCIAKENGVGCSKTVAQWLRDLCIFCRNIPEARALARVPGGRRTGHRALEAAGVPRVCARCGTTRQHNPSGKARLEVHHKDGNERNNVLENLEYLCTSCHQRTHAGWYA